MLLDRAFSLQAAGVLKVLQLTDTHLMAKSHSRLMGVDTESTFVATLKHALTRQGPYDLVLMTGDISQDGSAASYRRMADYLRPLNLPCRFLPGNHDHAPTLRSVMRGAGLGYHRITDMGGWRILALNSQVPGEDSGMLGKSTLLALEQAIVAATGPVLISLHHHWRPSGSVWLDSMIAGNRQAFQRLVIKHPNVRGVLSGHVHQVLEERLGRVHVMASPSTCFQFTPGSVGFSVDATPPGYRVLDLHDDGRIDSSIHRLTGIRTSVRRDASGY